MSDKKPEDQEPKSSGEQPEEAEPEYKVGYGKPPKHTKFGKGNKAGKGRKQGSKALKTVVNEAANTKTSVKIGGKTQKFTKTQLAVYQLANKASAGDLKAADKFLALVERYEPSEDPAEPTIEQLRPDIETLRDYLNFFDLIHPKNDGKDQEDGHEEAA